MYARLIIYQRYQIN